MIAHAVLGEALDRSRVSQRGLAAIEALAEATRPARSRSSLARRPGAGDRGAAHVVVATEVRVVGPDGPAGAQRNEPHPLALSASCSASRTPRPATDGASSWPISRPVASMSCGAVPRVIARASQRLNAARPWPRPDSAVGAGPAMALRDGASSSSSASARRCSCTRTEVGMTADEAGQLLRAGGSAQRHQRGFEQAKRGSARPGRRRCRSSPRSPARSSCRTGERHRHSPRSARGESRST